MKYTAKYVVWLAASIAGAVVVLPGAAKAEVPTDGPQFDTYMQALERNGYNLTPQTALRVAQIKCDGAPPWFVGEEMRVQGVPYGAQLRVFDTASAYMCSIK